MFSTVRNELSKDCLQEKKKEFESLIEFFNKNFFKNFDTTNGSHSMNKENRWELFSLNLFLPSHVVWEIGFGDAKLACLLAYYAYEVIATDIVELVYNQVTIRLGIFNDKQYKFKENSPQRFS